MIDSALAYSDGPATSEDLAFRTGLMPRQVAAYMRDLEARGLAVRNDGGTWSSTHPGTLMDRDVGRAGVPLHASVHDTRVIDLLQSGPKTTGEVRRGLSAQRSHISTYRILESLRSRGMVVRDISDGVTTWRLRRWTATWSPSRRSNG